MNTSALSTKNMIAASSTTRGVFAYLLIAFGVAWTVWIPLWLAGVPGSSDLFNTGMLIGLLGLPIAAFVVRRWVTREGFGDAGLWPNIRRAWPYYLFAWLWPEEMSFRSQNGLHNERIRKGKERGRGKVGLGRPEERSSASLY